MSKALVALFYFCLHFTVQLVVMLQTKIMGEDHGKSLALQCVILRIEEVLDRITCNELLHVSTRISVFRDSEVI